MWKREAPPVFNLPTRKNENAPESQQWGPTLLCSLAPSHPVFFGGFHVKQVANSCSALCAPPQWEASARRLMPSCSSSVGLARRPTARQVRPPLDSLSFWLLTTPFLLFILKFPLIHPLFMSHLRPPRVSLLKYDLPPPFAEERSDGGARAESREAFTTLIVLPFCHHATDCSWMKTIQPLRTHWPATICRLSQQTHSKVEECGNWNALKKIKDKAIRTLVTLLSPFSGFGTLLPFL